MPTNFIPEPQPLSSEEIQAASERAYQRKLSEVHKGSCSSPAHAYCPCQEHCPLHGRCCDCIRHHNTKGKGRRDLGWTPACVRVAAGNIIGDLECFRKGLPVPFAENLKAKVE